MKITIEFDSIQELLDFQRQGLSYPPEGRDVVSNIPCDISLDELLPSREDGSIRTKNSLGSQAIYTVDDLLKWSALELLRIPNLGRKSLDLITAKLTERGLRLKSSEG